MDSVNNIFMSSYVTPTKAALKNSKIDDLPRDDLPGIVNFNLAMGVKRNSAGLKVV